jgi:hypothetical protein
MPTAFDSQRIPPDPCRTKKTVIRQRSLANHARSGLSRVKLLIGADTAIFGGSALMALYCSNSQARWMLLRIHPQGEAS